MSISHVIQQRRKALGLTQEQVADFLGVTAPAVNKWEKGTSCPDIGLLSPLARLLKTDLNTLLEFSKEISRQELIDICRQISALAQNSDYAAAFTFAEQQMKIYPDNDSLIHNLALQLQSLLVAAGLDEDRNREYLKKINLWYERLARSENAVIRNGALYMLASYEMSLENYERAQSCLDRLPDKKDSPDKRMLQAGIYLKTNRAEDAVRLLQSALLGAVSDLQLILFRLADAELAGGNMHAAQYAAERAEKTAQLFDLSEYNSLAAHYQLAVSEKDAEKSLELLRRMLRSTSVEWSTAGSPLYRLVMTNSSGASVEKMIVPLLRSMKESSEFAFLHKHEGFTALLEEYGV